MPAINWSFKLLSLSGRRNRQGHSASSFRRMAFTSMLYLASFGVQAAVPHSPSPQVNQGKSDDVEVRGGISDSVLARGSKTWFFLSVSNHSPKTISVIRLRKLRADGFTIAPHCWCDAENSACGDPSKG